MRWEDWSAGFEKLSDEYERGAVSLAAARARLEQLRADSVSLDFDDLKYAEFNLEVLANKLSPAAREREARAADAVMRAWSAKGSKRERQAIVEHGFEQIRAAIDEAPAQYEKDELAGRLQALQVIADDLDAES